MLQTENFARKFREHQIDRCNWLLSMTVRLTPASGEALASGEAAVLAFALA
jgi:hypothetical protein